MAKYIFAKFSTFLPKYVGLIGRKRANSAGLSPQYDPNSPPEGSKISFFPPPVTFSWTPIYPHKRTFTPIYSPIHPWTYPDLPPKFHIHPKWLLPLKFTPIFSGGLGLISVVLISAILAGSGCHVLKKDTQENINELNKFITNLKGTVQKRPSGFIGPCARWSGNGQ